MVVTKDVGGEVAKHSVHTLVFRSQKRTHDMFISGTLGSAIFLAKFLTRL